ncbi:MAG: hypothetical protein AAF378_15045 [Cyanobacteria bacterium P01_A01_bin.84]
MAENNQKKNGCGVFLLGAMFSAVVIVGAGIWFFVTNRQAQQILSQQVNQIAEKNLPATDENTSSQKPQETTVPSKTNVVKTSKINTLPTGKTLNVQGSHPNGTQGRITKISFTKNSAIVKMEVTNGSKNTIELNHQGKGMVLIDDLNNQYKLAVPTDNPDLEILPGTTLKGEFIFPGKISPETKSLNLITNDKFGGNEDLSQIPKIIFFIPLKEN